MSVTDTWAGSARTNPQRGSVEERANETARTIRDKPSRIVISRLVNGATISLPPQTVRVDITQNIRGSNEDRNALEELTVTAQYVVLMGIRGHRYFPDADFKRADLFYYQERMYEILDIVDTVIGRVLASCKLRP